MEQHVTSVLVLFLLNHQWVFCAPRCFDHGVDLPTRKPLVIAHRGACGTLPEHTVEGYQRAVEEGADVVECDVCITRDLQLVCLHEPWLTLSTNIREMPEFSGRNRTMYIDDYYGSVNDWFSMDFTLDELKKLRKVQEKKFRDQSYNNLFKIATLEELIELVQSADRPAGLHIETKIPSVINQLLDQRGQATSMEKVLANLLNSKGYSLSNQPCFLQSFEEQSLILLKTLTSLPLVMLTWGEDPTEEQLERWSSLGFYGIGPDKNQLVKKVNLEPNNKFVVTEIKSNISERAHALGLHIHPYTYRNEHEYLAWNYSQDPRKELELFSTKVEVDGYFTDFPSTLKDYLEVKYEHCGLGSAPNLNFITATFVMLLLLNLVIHEQFLTYI